jgi:hypothetical protein
MVPSILARRRRAAPVAAICALVLAVAPAAARADRAPLDGLPRLAAPQPSLRVFPAGLLRAQAEPSGEEKPEKTVDDGTRAKPEKTADDGARAKPEEPPLDFDLLGEPEPGPKPPDDRRLRLRRRMLTAHQGVGIGLVGLQLATTVVGQLNYSDRFPSGPDTARYQASHRYLAYSTLAVFAVNGALALFAPSSKAPRRMDRVMAHRIAMFTAAAGMLTQGILGVATRERVGRLDQERYATAHLVVGYATLAAVGTGVAVLVF